MYNKKRVLGLVAFLLIAAAIPLTLSLVKQRQEIRKEAFAPLGVGEIELSLSPSSGSILAPESSVTFTVNIKNISTTSVKEIYVAGVDLSYIAAHFNISPTPGVNILCSNPNLPNAVRNFSDPNAGKIYLTCSRTPGADKLMIGVGQTVPLGTFIAAVTASAGTDTSFEFIRGVVPAAGTSVDMAIQPSGPSVYHILAPATPTPTSTPIPTATSTPVPTATPTPSCANGPNGDLDCDGWIGESDLALLLGSWAPDSPVPPMLPGQKYTADIANSLGGTGGDGKVDESDYNKLLDHWNPSPH